MTIHFYLHAKIFLIKITFQANTLKQTDFKENKAFSFYYQVFFVLSFLQNYDLIF